MNNIRVTELFESYFHFWVIKLNLQEKYQFSLKKDNRLNCHAQVVCTSQWHYEVKYNTTKLRSKYKIINVALHELGHLFLDWRTDDEVIHEAEAEYFALSTMKEHYPKFYKRALVWTQKAVYNPDIDEVHRQGYINALQRLGEFKA